MRVVQVLWTGNIGGAERLNAALAAELRRQGVDARIPFVCPPGALRAELDRDRVPYESLNLPTGSAVLRCPRRFGQLAGRLGADAAILVAVGYLGLALRIGGYVGKIVGVEHGTIFADQRHRRVLRPLERITALPRYDAEVAISHFTSSF
jgi:Glycosyltransferase Family 4